MRRNSRAGRAEIALGGDVVAHAIGDEFGEEGFQHLSAGFFVVAILSVGH